MVLLIIVLLLVSGRTTEGPAKVEKLEIYSRHIHIVSHSLPIYSKRQLRKIGLVGVCTLCWEGRCWQIAINESDPGLLIEQLEARARPPSKYLQSCARRLGSACSDLLNQLLRVAAAGCAIYQIQIPTLWPCCSDYTLTADETIENKSLQISATSAHRLQPTGVVVEALMLREMFFLPFSSVLFLSCQRLHTV